MNMGKVVFENSMSLDGFVAGPNDEVDEIFQWYSSGDTDFRFPGLDMEFKVSHASAEHLLERTKNIGASVTGRRTFNVTSGWGGKPPGGGPYFVVTHTVPQEWVKPDSPFTFVTDGVESAVQKAKQAAGDKDVSIFSANILQQCLKAGLVDEIYIDLAPVLIGKGIRLFERLGAKPIALESMGVIEGTGVTHLLFRVK
jgi:dihydrofolate reductase